MTQLANWTLEEFKEYRAKHELCMWETKKELRRIKLTEMITSLQENGSADDKLDFILKYIQEELNG